MPNNSHFQVNLKKQIVTSNSWKLGWGYSFENDGKKTNSMILFSENHRGYLKIKIVEKINHLSTLIPKEKQIIKLIRRRAKATKYHKLCALWHIYLKFFLRHKNSQTCICVIHLPSVKVPSMSTVKNLDARK